jgi:hypothetical protein
MIWRVSMLRRPCEVLGTMGQLTCTEGEKEGERLPSLQDDLGVDAYLLADTRGFLVADSLI